MKAIHVGNTRDSRLYYLIESDDQSTGAVVVPNQPAVYVDFFAYVSKKGSIERVMDSEFHKFFWTGHTGSLSERWEQTFIHRVTSPREMALSGVEILTEFKEKKKPSRVTQLNERANRAVEYKALIGAGLNEKAFARRGVRRIGRGIGEAATGGVRGFRRGVRFDDTAEDADGDGFVQEGTQHARRASATGMRSTWDRTSADFVPEPPALAPDRPQSFLPPDTPPLVTPKNIVSSAQMYLDFLNDPWVKAMDEMLLGLGIPKNRTMDWWMTQRMEVMRELIRMLGEHFDALKEKFGVLLDGNDPIEILDAYDKKELALRALIGGREIKTTADAKEIAFKVHPLFQHGKSEWTLLDRADDDPLSEHDRALFVEILTMLAANPLFKEQAIRLVESESTPRDKLAPGVAGMEQWQHGSEWEVDSQAVDALAERIKKVVDRMGGDWSESGMSREPFTPEQRAALLGAGADPSLIDEYELSPEFPTGLTGMEGEDTRRVSLRNLIGRLGDLLTPTRTNRKGRTKVTYQTEAKAHQVGFLDALLTNRVTLDDGTVERFDLTIDNPTFEGRYVTADAVKATLLAYAHTLPKEERNRVIRKAFALSAAAVVIHEVGGHSTHSANMLEWALRKLGPAPAAGGEDPRYKRLLTSAIETIAEKIKKIPLVEKMVLDSRTVSEYSKDVVDKGLGTVLVGQFGTGLEDLVKYGTSTSLFGPGEVFENNFHLRGIHGVLRHGTDIQKQRMKAWLSQPVMDNHGNPHIANSGLAKYFEELKEVALKEWGIDLTIGAGEQLTLAHILFGTNPHEDGLHALEGDVSGDGKTTYKSHKKGGFAFLFNAAFGKIHKLPAGSADDLQYRARKGRKEDGSHITEHTDVPAGGNEPAVKAVVIPDIAVIRQRGLPAFSTKKIVQVQDRAYRVNPQDPNSDLRNGHSIGIETTAVTPEDVAPLLDALAHVSHALPQLNNSELDPTRTIDEVLDQLEDITFDSVPDVEIGLTGKKLGEFLDNKSPEQQAAFREETATALIVDLLLQSLIGKHISGQMASQITGSDIDQARGLLEDPGMARYLNQLIEKVAMAAEWSDDLSDKHVRILEELADSLGYDDYAAYGGAVTGFDILDSLLGNTRHEMIAELITAMTLGLDLPIYKGGKRRPLKPEQISALTALYKLWHPDGTPKIRSRGRLAQIYAK